jgi:AcrR family transcriptional regulator
VSFPRGYRRTVTARASAAGDQARTRVLEVALDLFAAAGYRGTSIAQVAELAGLSQSGLLHHFPSKVALLVAALEYRDEIDGRLLEVDGRPPLGWAAFDALIGLVERNSQRPNQVRLFVTLSAEAIDPAHPAHDWVQQHYAGVYAWLTAAVEHGRDIGEFAPDVPVERFVHLTIAALDGLQIQWLVSGGELDMVGDFSSYIAAQKIRWSPVDAHF